MATPPRKPAAGKAAAAPAESRPGLLRRLVTTLFVSENGGKSAVPAKPAAGKREDPRAELARLIRSLRARIDPKLLRLAEKVVRKGPPTTDHERAMLSVELFLAQREDGGAFAAKLREKLEQERQSGGPTRH